MSLGERRARLLAERAHHPVVAIVAKQYHADQRRKRRAANFAKGGGYLGAALRTEVGEGAARKRGQLRQRAADVAMVALQAPQDVVEDQFVVGARHAIVPARGADRTRPAPTARGYVRGHVHMLHSKPPT